MTIRVLFVLLISILLISCKSEEEKEPVRATGNRIEKKVDDPLKSSVNRGREIYNELCVTCHLGNGKGVPGAFPPLNPSNWLTNKRTVSIHAVKYGLKGPIKVNGVEYNNIMLPLGLDDQEVADVLNYSIQTWNSGEIITLEDVQAVKE
jgi:mono/diheme cytochrome c family protein